MLSLFNMNSNKIHALHWVDMPVKSLNILVVASVFCFSLYPIYEKKKNCGVCAVICHILYFAALYLLLLCDLSLLSPCDTSLWCLDLGALSDIGLLFWEGITSKVML